MEDGLVCCTSLRLSIWALPGSQMQWSAHWEVHLCCRPDWGINHRTLFLACRIIVCASQVKVEMHIQALTTAKRDSIVTNMRNFKGLCRQISRIKHQFVPSMFPFSLDLSPSPDLSLGPVLFSVSLFLLCLGGYLSCYNKPPFQAL